MNIDEEYEILTVFHDSEYMNECMKIRHEVFCETHKWLPASAPGLESDIHDSSTSTYHIAVRHRKTNMIIGTARLLVGNFPSIKHYPDVNVNFFEYNARVTAEISRICLSKKRVQNIKEVGITLEYQPALALFIGIIRRSTQLGLEYWIAAMEPKLNKRLGMFGMALTQCGEIQDYYGKRAPFYTNVGYFVNSIKFHKPSIYEMIRGNK